MGCGCSSCTADDTNAPRRNPRDPEACRASRALAHGLAGLDAVELRTRPVVPDPPSYVASPATSGFAATGSAGPTAVAGSGRAPPPAHRSAETLWLGGTQSFSALTSSSAPSVATAGGSGRQAAPGRVVAGSAPPPYHQRLELADRRFSGIDEVGSEASYDVPDAADDPADAFDAPRSADAAVTLEPQFDAVASLSSTRRLNVLLPPSTRQ